MASRLGNRNGSFDDDNVEVSDDQNDTFCKKCDQLNSVDDVDQHSRPGGEKQHHNVPVLKDLRQNAVDLSNRACNHASGLQNDAFEGCKLPACHVVDRSKATVEDAIVDHSSENVFDDDRSTKKDHNEVNGTVDRRQSTFDSSNDSLTDLIVDQNNGGMVDRNKATVEEKSTVEDTSSDQTPTVTNLCPGGGAILDHNNITVLKQSRNVVDRDKKTVENTEPSTQSVSTDNDCVPASDIVDRGKKTVENTELSAQPSSTDDNYNLPGGNVVDRKKKTVENTEPSTQSASIDNGCEPASDIVDREKKTVESTESSTQSDSTDNDRDPTSCVVDREKKTVENTESTTQPSSTDDNYNLPGGNVIDCEKKTVENAKPSYQKVLDCQGKTRKRAEESSFEEKSRVQLQVTNASSPSVIDHLKKNACFKWGKRVVFGRGEGVDIFINDDGASRQHVELLAQILPDGQVSFLIRNISETKGYHFNDKEIRGNGLWKPLKKGDQIRIAGLVFVVVDIPARIIKETFVIEFIHPHVNHPQPNSITQGSTLIQSSITPDMVEHILQPYCDRKGYVKLKNLRHLAVEAVGEWKELGRALGLKDWEITMIDGDHEKTGEKSYQMLARWVYSKPEQATYQNLKNALEDITVRRGDLAEKYCNFEDN